MYKHLPYIYLRDSTVNMPTLCSGDAVGSTPFFLPASILMSSFSLLGSKVAVEPYLFFCIVFFNSYIYCELQQQVY